MWRPKESTTASAQQPPLKNTLVFQVKRQREVHRDRRRKVGTPVIGVVGYTSAGKSTLVSKLSRTHLVSRDRFFTTILHKSADTIADVPTACNLAPLLIQRDPDD